MSALRLQIPPLQSGDRLTREEFHERYRAMPDVKAELINGVVYMSSPVSLNHSDPHADLVIWAGTYAKYNTPGVAVSDNTTVFLSEIDEIQPDVSVYVKPEYGGSIIRTENSYLDGVPELAIEIAASSANIDSGEKLLSYQRSGVSEYIIWRVYDEEIDWFINRKGILKPLMPDREGIIRSHAFPGLWLDPAAMIRGDYQRIQQVLNLGLQSAEHTKFVQKLANRKKKLNPSG